jgi:predicted ATPase/DNA-binding SARP family transcriptional activator
MAHLALGVLGAMQATLADGQTVKFRSDQTRALLAYLAVEADRPHRREALTGLLWPEEPEEAARHNLRQALVNLRRTIGDSASHPPYLLITHHEIQFNLASDFALDAADFDAHLAACASHPHARLDDCAICAPRLQHAVDLYRGQFLQEFFLKNSAAFEEWALARREAFHDRALEALSALATYYEQHGDLGATRRCALRALELDPWREQAHRQMMRAFALEGQLGAALAQYETCRRVLADEMDVEPSTETRELYERLKTGHWNLPLGPSGSEGEVGSLHGTPTSRGEAEIPRSLRDNLQIQTSNVPVYLTPFIGRARELADLARLIGDPSCRLITLVGSGGIGKTRLAVQAASHQRNAFAQGAAFVPLVAIDSVEAIVPAIADALGFSFYGPIPPRLQLFSHVRDKQLLLILDNVEQLLVEDTVQGNAADLFVQILEHTSGIKLLVTSREPLNVQGEWVYPVEGLQIPEGDPSEAIESLAAVALFVQRAKRARAGFTLSEKDYPNLARLCRLVDGSPLALELAATWVRTLSVIEIVKEIERNLDFLSTTVRDLPERHRNMRVVFDHSWKLLTEEEQGVLLQLSVFHGGFRREAAEDVAGATLSVLSSLITKSLVRRSSDNRYDMHELIRQFATGYFSAYPEEQKETQARHGKYYLTTFAGADGRLRSPAQREALAEWTAEIDNIRVAWNWAVTQSEFGLIEQALRAFAMLYETRGWYQEGIDTLDRAIDALEAAHGPSPADRTGRAALGHLLTNRALLTYRLGRHEETQATLECSLRILTPLNDARLIVEPITYLGSVISLAGDYARALDLFADAREKALAVGDRVFAATSLSLHAHYSRLIGKPGNQHGRLQAAVAEWRAVGDPRFIGFGLNFLGQSALALGRFDEARTALEESVELNMSVGARWNLGHAFQGLGAVAQAQGEHQRAADMFLKAVNTFTELGGRFYMAQGLAQMGQSLFALGNEVEAGRVWRESLRIAAEIHGMPVALDALVGLASLRAKRGDAQSALDLLLIVLNHPASNQETKDRAEKLRRELKPRLTPQQIQAAQAKARELRVDQVINQVLEQS